MTHFLVSARRSTSSKCSFLPIDKLIPLSVSHTHVCYLVCMQFPAKLLLLMPNTKYFSYFFKPTPNYYQVNKFGTSGQKKHSFHLFCISRDSFLESMSSKVETIGRISEDGISKIQKVLLSDTECGKGIGGNPLDSSDFNF